MSFQSAVSGFLPKGVAAEPNAASVYRMNGGCGVRVYSNGINDGRDDTTDLFYEVKSADVERSTTDIAGSFMITLQPTAPWDELIRPDDFLRIFMGDQISTSDADPNAYNFASQFLDQRSAGQIKKNAVELGISVPLPNSLDDEGAKAARLIMHERMIGKVDRVQRMVAGPGPNQGTTIGFMVSGRSMGAIIQDISLYYNDFLAPFNAVNMFINSNIGVAVTEPGSFVKEALAILLTSIPFPQWSLPDALVKDLNYKPAGGESIKARNQKFVAKKLADFQTRLAADRKNRNLPTRLKGSAIDKLEALVKEAGTISSNSPLTVISLDGIFECLGSTFNRSLLSSVNTGAYDLIKYMTNDAFNEFWFDLCPGGDPEGGRATDDTLVPTFCLRQNPYDVTAKLISGLSKSFRNEAQVKLSSFPEQKVASSKDEGATIQQFVGASLIDLLDSSFSVTGSSDQPDLGLSGQFAIYADADNSGGYTPTVLPGGYEAGYSSHERMNLFLTTGAFNVGQADGSTLPLVSESGGLCVDVESIKKYGLRVMTVGTHYAQPNSSKDQEKSLGSLLATFSKLLANWYFLNPMLLNGQISCRFLKQARLGVPVKYFETRVTPANPYRKMELFYVQGVSDRFDYGSPISTTLTVVRGLRYDLGRSTRKNGPDPLAAVPDALAGFTS